MKILATVTSSYAGRKRLRGIARFCREHRELYLQIERTPTALLPSHLTQLKHKGLRGIISDFVMESQEEKVRNSILDARLPSVFFDEALVEPFAKLSRKAFVVEDHAAIARAALAHLDTIGTFASYVFYSTFSLEGVSEKHWCMARAREFRRLLSERGIPVRLLSGRTPEADIRDLPKPVAVFAGFDGFASRLIFACQAAGIAVPNEVSVVGVDDNEDYCMASEPAITSVRPDFERQGYLAAQQLLRLMSTRSRKTIFLVPQETPTISIRSSTRPAFRFQPTVKGVEEFVTTHVSEALTPDAVARHLGISRRLLDLRLSKAGHPTVQETILRARLETVQHLLATTTFSIDYITGAAGFSNANVLKNLFKRRFDCSMRAWRKQFRK